MVDDDKYIFTVSERVNGKCWVLRAQKDALSMSRWEQIIETDIVPGFNNPMLWWKAGKAFLVMEKRIYIFDTECTAPCTARPWSTLHTDDFTGLVIDDSTSDLFPTGSLWALTTTKKLLKYDLGCTSGSCDPQSTLTISGIYGPYTSNPFVFRGEIYFTQWDGTSVLKLPKS